MYRCTENKKLAIVMLKFMSHACAQERNERKNKAADKLVGVMIVVATV